MTRISPARNVPPLADDDEAAIARINIRKFQWKVALIWLLRISAMLCIGLGINYWMELLGLFKIDFNDRVTLHQFAIIFFAIIYCFASVGLWMAASWGVALWGIALVGEVFLLIFEPSLSVQNQYPLIVSAQLSSITYLFLGLGGIVGYVVLAWMAERQE